MTIRIAVAGKGGVGKTTCCSLIIQELIQAAKTPVLAVDADPNSGLGELLGISYEKTIADIRDDVRDGKNIPQGMAKSDYINMKLNEIIVESRGVDLLVMGRPEGRECYCYINELLRNFLSKISKNYAFVVLDNEAGMEHLSRRTTDNIDVLYLISEPTKSGMRAIARIYEIVKSIRLNIKKIYIVISKSREGIDYTAQISETGIPKEVELAGVIPFSNEILQMNEKGTNMNNADSDSVNAVKKLLNKTLG